MEGSVDRVRVKSFEFPRPHTKRGRPSKASAPEITFITEYPEEGPRRLNVKFSEQDYHVLRDAFKRQSKPNRDDCEELAAAIGHDVKNVITWFQNERFVIGERKREMHMHMRTE